MKRSLAVFLSICMLAAMLAGCAKNNGAGNGNSADRNNSQPANQDDKTDTSPESPEEEKVLIVRHSSEPATLQPNKTTNDPGYNIISNIYSRLVKLDGSRQVIPDLASSWETSEDGLTMTFHLVDNAYWHDGERVTSEDVKYTFDYILNDETCLRYKIFSTYVESFEAPDDLTFVINLKAPYAGPMLGYLGYYATFILPQHLFDNGQDWDDNPCSMTPVGSGPFKYDSTIPGVSITLVKNENYFQNEVNIDRLVFQIIPDITTTAQALYSGDIDFTFAIPDSEAISLLNNDDYTLNLNTLPSPTYMFFNFEDETLAQLAVRKAIAMCINREEISTKVFNGIRQPEWNFYPSIIDWVSNSDAPAPAYDVEGTKAVLEEAGFTQDADGYYVRGLVLDCFSTDSNPDIAKLIVASCEEAGIEITVNSMEYQAWTQKVSDHNFQLAIMGGFQGPDVTALYSRVGTDQNLNYGGYSNARVDELFTLGLNSTDNEIRKPYYHEIQEILSQELPIVPIVQYATYHVQASYVVDTPQECVGRASWNEFSYTDIVG